MGIWRLGWFSIIKTQGRGLVWHSHPLQCNYSERSLPFVKRAKFYSTEFCMSFLDPIDMVAESERQRFAYQCLDGTAKRSTGDSDTLIKLIDNCKATPNSKGRKGRGCFLLICSAYTSRTIPHKVRTTSSNIKKVIPHQRSNPSMPLVCGEGPLLRRRYRGCYDH